MERLHYRYLLHHLEEQGGLLTWVGSTHEHEGRFTLDWVPFIALALYASRSAAPYVRIWLAY